MLLLTELIKSPYTECGTQVMITVKLKTPGDIYPQGK